MREVINAILYLDRLDCRGRALTSGVSILVNGMDNFRTLRNDGAWKRMHSVLREQVRQDVLLQVVAHLIGIPLRYVEQALHAIRRRFPCQLG